MPPSNKRMKIDEEEIIIINEVPSTSKGKNEDWREFAEGFKARHQTARKLDILTDISFAVGPQGKNFSAHKMILALASPVFEVMFYGSLKETTEKIGIPDLMPNGFQLLLDYIYTDEIELKNETDALYAWFAADKYCLTHMRALCCKYLLQCTLTDNNVWIILENASLMDSSLLVDRCLAYLKKNIDEAMEAPGFLEISGATLKKILAMDSLYIKEVRLLKGIVRWSEERIKNGAEESLQQLSDPFLAYIRFACMSQLDFIKFIDHNNVISDADALEILKYMTDNREYSLPNWCSPNVYPRRACEKRQGTMNGMTQNIRSYAIKPLPRPINNEFTRYLDALSQSYHSSQSERNRYSPQHVAGPSRRHGDENNSHYYSSSSDDGDGYDNASRRAVDISNLDSDDSSSSGSSPSSSSGHSSSN